MRPALLESTLKALIKIGRTTCIEGPPGGGKTTIVGAVADALNLHYIERHLPTMLVEDFGIPTFKDGVLVYSIPDWFPAKGSRWDDGRGGVLCFDDRNQANADIQKVLANICQARNLHGVEMADGWTVVSTGNRMEDRAGANKVLSHLRNRETVITLETDLNDSTTWMINNDVKAELISFLRFRPGLLHDFDPKRDSNPTPRSWVEGVAAVIDKVPPESEFECFKGAVGEGAAAEFVGFLKIFRQLPNPDNVLMNPETAKVPSDPATLYALSGALAERASQANFDRLVTYVSRMPPEFSVLTVSYAARKTPDVVTCAAFTKWATTHNDVLF